MYGINKDMHMQEIPSFRLFQENTYRSFLQIHFKIYISFRNLYLF